MEELVLVVTLGSLSLLFLPRPGKEGSLVFELLIDELLFVLISASVSSVIELRPSTGSVVCIAPV